MIKNENDAYKYFISVMEYLGHPDNRNSYFVLSDLLTTLNIPKEYKTDIWNKIWYGRPALVSATENKIRDPDFKINDAGLKFVQKLENEYFEEHRSPMYPRFGKALPIDETCEVLFQMHKEDSQFKVVWTFVTYAGKPANLNVAKDKMLHNRIILDYPSKNTVTILNPDLFEATSYRESLRMLEEFNKPQLLAEIKDSFNSTTTNYKDVGNIASKGGKIEQQINPAPEKQNFFQKILGDMRNAIVSHLFVAGVSLIIGAVGTKWLSQKTSQATSPQTHKDNINVVPPNKGGDSLEKSQPAK